MGKAAPDTRATSTTTRRAYGCILEPVLRILPPALLAVTTLTQEAAADDLMRLGDEFDNANTLPLWQDLGLVEGWTTPSYEQADIDTTTAGRFRIVPGAITWFDHLRGLLFFKEVSGDFVATTRVRVLSRHNPGDPTEVPNRSFSLTGIFVHGPRPAITQAAPLPYTTNAVWPPGNFGSNYVPDTENYIFLSYGTAGNPGTRQFEIKATRNSDSELYYDSTGISQTETEAWLQMVRVGDTVVCLRKHSAGGNWIVENRYPNADHPFPAFGATLQVGITAYTDWPTASPFSGSVETAYHFNYAPPSTGSPDLVSEVDYFRLRRPAAALTEAVLQGMSVSYDPATDSTANPPVLLSASAAAAPHLGDNADTAYAHTPYELWRIAQFGAAAWDATAEPEADPDGDGLSNAEEFALGSNPTDPLSAPRPDIGWDGDRFTFTFTPDTGDAGFAVWESPDLAAWNLLASKPAGGSWGPDATGVQVAIEAGTGAVEVSAPGGASRTFLQLRITVEEAGGR